jgi:hypothetical protein
MPDASDVCMLLQTKKNKVQYTIFRRNEFEPTGTVDHSIITFCISTLESFRRSSSEDASPLVSAPFATDSVHGLVQIMARKKECSTSRFLCWAEDGELITGTAIVHIRGEEFFGPLLSPHGDFEKTMRGNLLPHYHLFAYAHDAGIARFSMVSVCMRQRLALSLVDNFTKLVV